ncbi:M23 family metallopeptidase [Actinospongicola halichondriae]|uniref:M23 family metallopeptidase n=1 Tax=Actinospongicola halichondriae TaxID=3236844 RepID=UPI003D5CA28B
MLYERLVGIPWYEAIGLREPRARMKEALVAIRGAEDVPPSKFGLSSLRMLDPRMSLPLWAGRFRKGLEHKAVITNLFNHTPTPVEDGWSVEKSQVQDFRNRGLTYNSHNGTDFSVPVGTALVSPAPGRVARVYDEYNRGGLKIVVDHGDGLMTCCAHTGRAEVEVGQTLERGELMGRTGYSGLDSLVTFPWGVPHVHFNVWFDGHAVDPFPTAQNASLWLGGDHPRSPAPDDDASLEPSHFDMDAVDAAIAACRTPSVRETLSAMAPQERALTLICEWNYYPTRFPEHPPIHATPVERRPRLTLPFRSGDIDGIVFADEL